MAIVKRQCEVVVVNYRSADLVINCLRSLEPEIKALDNCRVAIVDNASCDGSVEKLAALINANNWSDWVELFPLSCNGGFAFGNNAVIRSTMSQLNDEEYILLLNPDTVVKLGAVKALIDFMGDHPEVGITGSCLENHEGGIECSAHIFPSPLGELDQGARLGFLSRFLSRYVVSPPVQSQSHSCDWVSGASMLIRRSVFEDIGLLDEDYFLYFEEVDFCKRAKIAGWECWYVPESKVMHLEGASTGIRATDQRRPTYWYDSRRRYFAKHHGISGLILADLLWAIGRSFFLIRRYLKLGAQGPCHDPKRFASDLLLGDLRSLLNGEVLRISRARLRS